MRFFIRPNAEDVTLSWPKRALSQAAYRLGYDGDDPDLMQMKIEGLSEAMRQGGQRRGLIVTLGRSERIPVEEGEIEIIDADTFLSE